MLISYTLENQQEIFCDFEDDNCNSVLDYGSMIRMEVMDIERTTMRAIPEADHTFAQGTVSGFIICLYCVIRCCHWEFQIKVDDRMSKNISSCLFQEDTEVFYSGRIITSQAVILSQFTHAISGRQKMNVFLSFWTQTMSLTESWWI